MQQEGQLLRESGPNGGNLTVPCRVDEVMTRETLTLRPEQRFTDAVALMANQFIRHILVVDSEERLCGVISDRDVLRALARTPDWNSKMVNEIMTGDSITITADASISSAVKLILEKRINCLPVIGEDDRVCGILTTTDLLKAFENIQIALEQHPASVSLPTG